ncbi:MAG: hypothetical protein DMG04_20375 [Acidobacteria bacterium]|nr:MAG: hypothetical protein DMG04_20375 [Acidobacteriota bacterium]
MGLRCTPHHTLSRRRPTGTDKPVVRAEDCGPRPLAFATAWCRNSRVLRAKAAVDLWLKDIAPSVDLRRWFNHDPSRWSEFVKRYSDELDKKHTAVSALIGAVRRGRVTLLFGARDPRHNNAVALHRYLTERV